MKNNKIIKRIYHGIITFFLLQDDEHGEQLPRYTRYDGRGDHIFKDDKSIPVNVYNERAHRMTELQYCCLQWAKKGLHFLCSVVCLTFAAPGQESRPGIDFESYNPRSTLVVPEHDVGRARYPFIDVHSHQGRIPSQDLQYLRAQMDSLNMRVMVNLSGRGFRRSSSGFDIDGNEYLRQSLSAIEKNGLSKRIVQFTNISFNGFGQDGWIENVLQGVREDVRDGAKGLKIFKNLGFSVKDENGKRVPVDDPRLDPVWQLCGSLGIPVLIHSGDPEPFWQDPDYENERLLELYIHPDRKRDSSSVPSWEKIMQEQLNVFRRHRSTTFIAAHMGWRANDLQSLGRILDTLPNVYVEFAAVIAELGRQPRAAKVFFERYQDRILFGKDSWVPSEYPTYFRLLETDDEYFPYHKKYHAFWRMYGLGLTQEILKKVYFKNALRIIPGLDPGLFPE